MLHVPAGKVEETSGLKLKNVGGAHTWTTIKLRVTTAHFPNLSHRNQEFSLQYLNYHKLQAKKPWQVQLHIASEKLQTQGYHPLGNTLKPNAAEFQPFQSTSREPKNSTAKQKYKQQQDLP
jgi:hypothetical protein